jgi:hypothetical protein
MASSLRNRKSKRHQNNVQHLKIKTADIDNNYSDIMWFKDVNKSDAYRVGGKGANLGECANAGLPVPNGFCIKAGAFDKHLSTYNVDVEKDDSKEIRKIILKKPMNQQLIDSIQSAYASLSSKKNPLVAVRSSATAEDGAYASFAGQMETFLGVSKPSQVVLAVRHCWASVFADRVAAYRTMSGDSAGSCCVVVQLLIEADVAGVMFTANPLTGNLKECVVTANWGIGESVVADLATPDTYIVNSENDTIVSTTVGSKAKMVVLIRDENTATTAEPSLAIAKEVNVPNDKRSIQCLSKIHIDLLINMGRKVLRHYNNVPQDMEWAIQDNTVYLLQSRPITTLGSDDGEAKGDISLDENIVGTVGEFDWYCCDDDWITTCNSQEMFPGAGTPLTISVFGTAVEYGMQTLHMDYITTMKREYHSKRLRTGWYNGHFFINMTNTLYMLTQMIGGQMGKENGEMSILGRINEQSTMEELGKIHGVPWLPFRVINSMGYV